MGSLEVENGKGDIMRKRLKRWLLNLAVSFMVLNLTILPVGNLWAYHHHDSMVKWREYGAAAFDEAKRTGKPIFMLISAIWCYNCHIYWENSLETKEVSAYINENFIPVFVDYDRRKDIARSYPAGGIPVTVIIAPTGESLISVPGYIEKDVLLGNLKKTVAYVKEEFKAEAKAAKVVKRGRGITLPAASGLKEYLNGFEKMVGADYDPVYGGFGQAAKMVNAEKWRRLLEVYERGKEKELIVMSRNTLDHMAGLKQKKVERKRPSFKELLSLREREKTALEEVDRLQKEDRIVGIYDPIEGGFFRYATQRDWSIPHYEKMLMENAEMAALFVEGHRVTKDKRYREAAVKSIDYMLNNLYDSRDGAFYGSQDADEVYYHFTAEERKRVKAPRVDRTAYTSSSARTVIMMLDVSEEMKDERYRKAGLKGLSFLEKNLLSEEGALSYYDAEKKKGFINGQLEDNAWLALAFLKGYAVSKERRYLEKAEAILRFSIDRLYDRENGGFFERKSTSREFYREEELFLDTKPDSQNGPMAYVLLRAYEATNSKDYLKKAEETVGYFVAEFASGELTDIDPYMHRAAQMLMDSGRHR
jgi:uncharacterized protein YyaL (SSP411 family)